MTATHDPHAHDRRAADEEPVMRRTPDAGDLDFEDTTIVAVDPQEGGWAIKQARGWHFWVPAEYGVEPKVGDSARFYPAGIGHAVRGLILDGVTVFYRTAAEQRVRFEQERDERDAQRRREFEEQRADHDRRIEALPYVFRRRIEKFQKTNPDFRWQHEGYELFVCEEAVRLASAFPTVEALEAFATADWDEQKRLDPALSDQHSGNTFGIACRLARLFIEQPSSVVFEHGALTPLVGCKAYGCPHPYGEPLAPARPAPGGDAGAEE